MIKFVTAALLAVAIPTAAMADTLTGEVLFSDPRGGSRTDTTEYRVEAWKSVGKINLGAELQTIQPENEGKVKSLVSFKAGTSLPTIAGVHTVAYAEVGHNIADRVAGGNHEFWGAAIKAQRPIAGGFSVNAGYRHREGFSGSNLKEDRLLGGISYAVNKNHTLGVTYYRTRTGGNDTDAIGVNLAHKF